ncbi:DUF1254 domain-containing protein [Bythopirellula goksoeyrii]|uniref:DUF1254 domain-containing protein n=1 Tax=Bythopirellula goksoeyrii TaxID=1400387 RepID=A0A5B9Q5F1_9BACT|nr:DUF1254 domain-containing protein [Bythopirellula goksoeyrii]QEG34284.1 hypothetical protein Pr1d_15580 [Bythopirellula goksoeyrii]
MKSRHACIDALTLMMAIVVATTCCAQERPTDPIGGKPPVGAKPSFTNFATFQDQVLYQRAFEAVLWSVPMVNKLGLRRGTLAIGGGDNVVLAWSAGATPKFEALTPNNVSPYVLAMTDLRKGPVVLEIPAANDKAIMFGQIADHWYQTFVDIGPIGVDKGKGAKLLLTPPGYTDKVPAGYIEVKSVSFRPDMAIRSIPTPAGSPVDAEALGKQMKMYYLSELPNPAPTKFIDPLNMQWPTLARYDERWFEDIHNVISVEPSTRRDMVMMGMLKTIGIEKDKPYAPDEKTKAIYRKAVVDAYHYMQETFAEELPGEAWWADRKWRDIFFCDANKSFKWETADLVDYDMRAVRPWFSAIYFPAKVAEKPATMYIATMRDADGNLFEAGKTYSLTVPKDVPVKQFWSLTIYDRDTWAFIYSPQMLPGLSSRDTDKMTKNADGSVTLYFGPEGLETNWIPTSGKAPYAMFRFYGPEEAFYNKTFKLADVELVK